MTIEYQNMKTLKDWISSYKLTEECNDAIFSEFLLCANSLPFLKYHRDWVERNDWGFGDRAHHYMWYLILQHLSSRTMAQHLLEVGVFKGQVISLWSLIAKEIGKDFIIHAVSPFMGNRPNLVCHFIKKLFSLNYKVRDKEGNLYKKGDYLAYNKQIFSYFGLDFSHIIIHQGYSEDNKVQSEVAKNKYGVVYIDGDHSYNGCLYDIVWLAPLIIENGLLVIDDASCLLPGKLFFKGHISVSKACEIIPSLGFSNVLNVGHNRIFMKSRS